MDYGKLKKKKIYYLTNINPQNEIRKRNRHLF